jgi:hypothetical protein
VGDSLPDWLRGGTIKALDSPAVSQARSSVSGSQNVIVVWNAAVGLGSSIYNASICDLDFI